MQGAPGRVSSTANGGNGPDEALALEGAGLHLHRRTTNVPRRFRRGFSLCAAGAALVLPLAVGAQTVPDAGQVLEQQLGARLQEPERAAVDIPLPAASPATAPQPGSEGGPTVRVKGITLSGVTAFDEAELLAEVSSSYDHDLDFAGIRRLADRITAFYRRHGYTFASTYMPAQTVVDGIVALRVVEGRYGEITATGAEPLGRLAQPFLAGLRSGSLIRSGPLERVLLLLSDQPGIQVAPYIEPGKQAGLGDLRVAVKHGDRLAGSIGMDNNGSRYTGAYRLQGGVEIRSPFVLGDQLSFNGLLSDEQLWLGSVAYEAPLAHKGLRSRFSYAHSEYQLVGEFASLGAVGLAHVLSGELEYPVVRSQAATLHLLAGVQMKWLHNRYGAVDLSDNQSSFAQHLSARFDRRDSLLGGGVLFGSASWWHGKLALDPAAVIVDQVTARKNGHFQKWTLDLARLQYLPHGLGFYSRFSAQWSDSNLEGSERISLGGSDGVRAYPVGEGVGDVGWLAQAELRFGKGLTKPYAFFDIGRTRTNRFAWDDASADRRAISGAGLGLRTQLKRCSVDSFLAWSTAGGEPLASPGNYNPRFSSRLSCSI